MTLAEEIETVALRLVQRLFRDEEAARAARHDAHIRQTATEVARQTALEVFRKLMDPETNPDTFLITKDQLAQLTGVSNEVLQTISDAASDVSAEMAAIPAQMQAAADKAVKDALAQAGVQALPPPVDLSSVFQTLANAQGGAHNIAVAAQQGGASAPPTLTPPVTDPTTGQPVPVTAPVVTVDPDATDTSETPTAPAASSGTDGTGSPPADTGAAAQVGDTITIPGVEGAQKVTDVAPDGTITTEPLDSAEQEDASQGALQGLDTTRDRTGGAEPSGVVTTPGAADQPASVNPGLPAGVTDQATGEVQAAGAVQSAAAGVAQVGGAPDPTDPALRAAGGAATDAPFGTQA